MMNTILVHRNDFNEIIAIKKIRFVDEFHFHPKVAPFYGPQKIVPRKIYSGLIQHMLIRTSIWIDRVSLKIPFECLSHTYGIPIQRLKRYQKKGDFHTIYIYTLKGKLKHKIEGYYYPILNNRFRWFPLWYEL